MCMRAICVDGNTLYSASSAKIIVWDVESGEPLRHAESTWGRATALAFAGHGDIVIGSADGGMHRLTMGIVDTFKRVGALGPLRPRHATTCQRVRRIGSCHRFQLLVPVCAAREPQDY